MRGIGWRRKKGKYARKRRITMNELLNLAFALITGVLLGAIFFGGLWWTVRHGVSSKHAALWFLGSMLLRTSIVLSGFYLVFGDDWNRLLAGLLGFIIAR